MENTTFRLINQDCIVGLREIESNSIDCILTDPPYKYLKNQKLEVDFDETKFFNEAKRVLKQDGFIVLFGRGVSFYRWNCILNDLGFQFKEEIVWDKSYTSSPVLPISRVHETISIFTKGKGKIRNVKIEYLEMREYNMSSTITDIKRLQSAFRSKKNILHIENLVKGIRTDYQISGRSRKHKTTCQSETTGVREVKALDSMCNGMKEKSIIKVIRGHYKTFHPTQKPVRLLERLLQLTTDEQSVVLDPFAGSGSTGIACRNLNRYFIGFEIDKEYFDLAMNRVKEYYENDTTDFDGTMWWDGDGPG